MIRLTLVISLFILSCFLPAIHATPLVALHTDKNSIRSRDELVTKPINRRNDNDNPSDEEELALVKQQLCRGIRAGGQIESPQRFGKIIGSYLPADDPHGGVTAVEFARYLDELRYTYPQKNDTRIWITSGTYRKVKFDTSKSLCRQLDCIGQSGVLKICDFRSTRLQDGYLEIDYDNTYLKEFPRTFWPFAAHQGYVISVLEYPGPPIGATTNSTSYVEQLNKEDRVTWSCALDASVDHNRKPRTTDRFTGTLYYKENTDIQITIEGARPVTDSKGSITGRGVCDPSLNYIPRIGASWEDPTMSEPNKSA
ncbi:hypothetical protein H072_3818 [Dactylellina haptotyla CBS 200.50]|uniref:Uncharacterized protein n=1 Tax=Dactylellina haptotyla (strain CBS 200.50) TaxID=1284197 RepID=S8AGS5_DACHA|nr:hypothetical protein H072_3818 [Dactylellina haptotyla CBS 200.50]